MTNKNGFSTRAIHEGQEPNRLSGDVVVPIHMASTFARKEVDKPTGGYEYSRTGNPTRTALEKCLASLEGAKYGLVFASGLAAEANVLMLLKKGDHVVAFDDLYGGTKRLFNQVFANLGIEFSYVDMRDAKNVKNAIRGNTKLVWLESPTNPLMRLCDIKEIATIAKGAGAITVADNTFMSPYFQRPLGLGADIVLHSTTKYLGGHSDLVGGAVMVDDDALYERLKFLQNAVGATSSPFNDWLVLRGAKTLAVRMRQHEKNAREIAKYLESHRKVLRVHYPGLPSHPQHELAKRQMFGFGGMISFEIDGDLAAAKRFLENLRIFSLAESLGGVESLAESPALMTHASLSQEERGKIGISDMLVRLSVGIEDAEDLIKDIETAMTKAKE